MPPAITMSTVNLDRIDLLLDLAEGDRIDWAHPDGRTLGVEVVEVTYQPERAGHYHL
jgi:hypothetical protein